MTTIIPTNVAGFAVFQPDQAGGLLPKRAIFTQVDGFSAQVPVSAASLFESAWINGLVTRLVLEQYSKFWATLPATAGHAPLPAIPLSTRMDADPSNSPLTAFLTSASWPQVSGQPNTVAFKADFKALIATQPLTSYGMLYGWKAADSLVKSDTTNQTLSRAIWGLIHSRYSLCDIGRMTSYTLDYLAGATLNQRIATIVGSGSDPGKKNPTQILDAIAQDSSYHNSKVFLTAFQDVLYAEEYAASQIRTRGLSCSSCMTPEAKQTLLTRYFYFTSGFSEGVAKGADATLLQIASTSYEVGYTQGFNDGYSAGFAVGYQDGYAVGYANAWADATVTINALNQQIATLQQQLQQAQSGGGGGGGFWNTVGTALGDAGTVIGIIGSFF